MRDFKAKCTKFDFCWGSDPDSAGGGYCYSALSDPLAVFKRPTSKGEEGRQEKISGRGKEGKGSGREEEGKGRKGSRQPPKYFGLEPPLFIFSCTRPISDRTSRLVHM